MSYTRAVMKLLPAFIGGRLIPTIGITTVFVLMAHKSPEDLAVFAYVLAATSVIAMPLSLILATVGNRAAALVDNAPAQRDLFTGGFTLALLVAVLASAGCWLIIYLVSTTDAIQQLDRNTFWTLSLIYIASAPLLVINTYLYLFLEATSKASRCGKGRILVSLAGGACLVLLALVTSSHDFKYCAMAYFLATELLTLLFLIRLSGGQRYCSLSLARKAVGYFARTGIPVAAGMCGQKLYFYLLTERLVRIEASFVAELSIFMSAFGLLVIPSLALAQLHSLQVSQYARHFREYYNAGLIWNMIIMALSTALLYAAGESIFLAIGGSLAGYNTRLYIALIVFLTASSLLSLALAHLRAWNETLIPQLLINTIMLAILIPALYTFNFASPDMETFLLLQSAAVFAGFLLLSARIFLHGRN